MATEFFTSQHQATKVESQPRPATLIVEDQQATIVDRGKKTIINLEKADGTPLSYEDQVIIADTLNHPYLLGGLVRERSVNRKESSSNRLWRKRSNSKENMPDYTLTWYPDNTFDIKYTNTARKQTKPTEVKLFDLSPYYTQEEEIEPEYEELSDGYEQYDTYDTEDEAPYQTGVYGGYSQYPDVQIDEMPDLPYYPSDDPYEEDYRTREMPLVNALTADGREQVVPIDFVYTEPLQQRLPEDALDHLDRNYSETTGPLTRQNRFVQALEQSQDTIPTAPRVVVPQRVQITPEMRALMGAPLKGEHRHVEFLPTQPLAPQFEDIFPQKREEGFMPESHENDPQDLLDIVEHLQVVSDSVPEFVNDPRLIADLKISSQTLAHLDAIARLGMELQITPAKLVRPGNSPYSGFAKEYLRSTFYGHELRHVGLGILQLGGPAARSLRKMLLQGYNPHTNRQIYSPEEALTLMAQDLDWQHDAIQALQSSKYNEHFTDIIAKHPSSQDFTHHMQNLRRAA